MNTSKRCLKPLRGRGAVAAMAVGAMIVLMAVPALASSDLGRTEDQVAVPFRVERTIQVVSFGGGRCGEVPTATLVGESRGTHIGRSTDLETICFNPATLAFDVEATLTAADGSELLLESEGQLIPTGTPGLFEIDGAATFVGGTGRFEGATGSADGGGTFNLATGQGTNIIDGTLTLAV